MNVRELLAAAARRHASRIAIEAGPRRLTFAEAWGRGCALARRLRERGLPPGARIGVLADNTLDATDALLGLAAGGYVRVPLYARNAMAGHVQMLGGSGCVALLRARDTACASELDAACRADGIEVATLDADALLAEEDDAAPLDVAPDHLHVIRHTGGTTGRPRPVGYSHRQWIEAAKDWFCDLPRVRPDDVLVHACPVSHGSGYCFLPVWLGGAANMLVRDFDPDETLDALMGRPGAMTFLVPTMLAQLVERARESGRATRGAKCVQVASAPVAPRTLLRARAVFGPVVYQLYGQTEALPVTLLRPEDWAQADADDPVLTSVGRPLPYALVEIRDLEEPRRRLPPGARGEVALRCGAAMPGFLDEPDGGGERVVDGWVLTGDIGEMDEAGFLRLVDRKSQTIVSGGFNIYPAEIEAALLALDGVIEAIVFGVPDERFGERPHAVCRVSDAVAISESEVIEHCAKSLGSFRKPARVELWKDPLPRTPVGKLDRASLRDRHWDRGGVYVNAV